MRGMLNNLVNWIIFIVAITAFASGFVIMFYLHIDDGIFATSAFGIDRLIWINTHKLSAIVVFTGVIVHIGLHWRVFKNRLTKLFSRNIKKAINSDLFMYFTFSVAILTALITWIIMDGSSSLFGPAILGHPSVIRHNWIDVHQVASILSLILVIHHVKHRWSMMLRQIRRY